MIRGGAQTGRRIDAETSYEVAYGYRSRSRWRVDPVSKEVVVHVRYVEITWKPTHSIWLRRKPPADRFWSDPLVLHEFDHVRISSDQRLAKRFRQRLRERSTLRRRVHDVAAVDSEMVDGWIDDEVRRQFREMSELIRIRYQELDRWTDHGLRPLPTESPLNELLRGAGQDDPER